MIKMKVVRTLLSFFIALTMFVGLIPNYAVEVSAASSENLVTYTEDNLEDEAADIVQDSEGVDEEERYLDSSEEATSEEGTASEESIISEEEVVPEEDGNAETSETETIISEDNTDENVNEPPSESSEDTEDAVIPETISVVQPTISYRTHIQGIGWQGAVENGALSGTTGQGRRLEAINIELLDSSIEGSVRYRTHVQGIGWQDWAYDGAVSGTTAQGRRLEAIQIELTGEMANQFDVYYRVHTQQFGWLDWAKNGESAGTAGFGYRAEAIQIVLVEKDGEAPGPTSIPFQQAPTFVNYSTHIQNIGWQASRSNGATSGTTGQGRRLEAIRINLSNREYSGGIRYRTHVQNIGWQDWAADNAVSGTTGQNRRLEAIQVELTGEMANQFDVYYRVHTEQFGWLDWAKNGESAGTAGYSFRAEAIQVVLVRKGEAAPGPTATPFQQAPTFVNYSTHIQGIGWQDSRRNGATSGTTGQERRIEAIRINLSNREYSGSIQYRSLIEGIGWQDWVADNAVSGTTGQGRRLEAIQIQLTGEMANQFDIYYRVHSQRFGWLDWAKNGESAGTDGLSLRSEAIQVVLVRKGEPAPGPTDTPFKQTPTVFIDPGHGGNDPGAVFGNHRESDIVLSVGSRLNTIIENRSELNTMMTRSANDAQGITLGSGVATTGESVLRRAEFATANKQTEEDIFVSIHVNAFTNTSVSGAETFFYNSSLGRATRSTNPYVEESRALAQYIQNRIVTMVGMNDRNAKHGDFGVLRTNGMPAVLTELGFITNDSDRAKLISNTHQQLFAEAIYQGILDYYESRGLSVNSWR